MPRISEMHWASVSSLAALPGQLSAINSSLETTRLALLASDSRTPSDRRRRTMLRPLSVEQIAPAKVDDRGRPLIVHGASSCVPPLLARTPAAHREC